jgi:hypothetical protein
VIIGFHHVWYFWNGKFILAFLICVAAIQPIFFLILILVHSKGSFKGKDLENNTFIKLYF